MSSAEARLREHISRFTAEVAAATREIEDARCAEAIALTAAGWHGSLMLVYQEHDITIEPLIMRPGAPACRWPWPPEGWKR